jgi:subtilisin family serine protease
LETDRDPVSLVWMGWGALAGLAVIVLAGITAAAASGHLGAQAATRTHEFVPGELIVRFKPGLDVKTRSGILGVEKATLVKSLRVPGAALVEVPTGQTVAEAVVDFEQRPEVVSAQPNYVYRASVTSSDPMFGLLWGLNNLGHSVGSVAAAADADIDAPEAWDLTTGSRAVRVAVVDTGVAYDHPDLAGNIAALGPDYYAGDNDPRDENGHGTHVAGTIGARNNGVGVIGVSWEVGLVPIRVLGPTGSGSTATITEGFRSAAAHGARVVNASLGGMSYDPLMAATIAAAPETLFVVAAGNGGRDGIGDDNDVNLPVYPCSYALPNVVCVAATDAGDSLATFSNFGATSVDLGAPGVGIWSTYAGGGYQELRGTSMASPHVAGVAALMLARNPAATAGELRAALLASVDVLAPLHGKVAASGRLNAHKAVLAVAPSIPSPTPPPTSPVAAPVQRPVKKKVTKVVLCFRKRTVKVAKSRVARYKQRGARIGACKSRAKRR